VKGGANNKKWWCK